MTGSYFYLLIQDQYPLLRITYLFLVLMVLISALIIGLISYKKRCEASKKLCQQSIAEMMSQAIFFTDLENEKVEITYKIEMLLKNNAFRNCVINELIQAKKNLSGASTNNLKKLYEILRLDNDSFRKLNNAKWHIKAKGIQELAIMDQVQYLKQIFRLTNTKNELVRNEAQCALVSFYGFLGLRFLNVAAKPISQWQQIQLLNKLNNVKPTNFDAIKKWLRSTNESVVVFSLKLATFYNCNTVYDDVIPCLKSNVLAIKLSALEYVKTLPKEDTAKQIVAHYFFDNKKYRIAIIDALKEIGNEQQIPFLLNQLNDIDDDIKSAAAKTLSYLHPSGAAFLQTHLLADQNPWKAIFLQIKNERAA